MSESIGIPLSRSDSLPTRAIQGRQSVIALMLLRKKKRSAMGSSVHERTFVSCPPAIAQRRGRLQYGAEEEKPLKWSHSRNKRRQEVCSPRSLWNMKIAVFIGAFSSVLWLKHYSLCSDGMSDCLLLSYAMTSNRSRKKAPIVPRVLQYNPGGLHGKENPDEWKNWRPSKRKVQPMGDPVAQRQVRIDDTITLDQVETEDCKLRYEWQKSSFPTCNLVHEVDTTSPWISHGLHRQKQYRVVGHGYWRDVWILNLEFWKERGIFKTMRYKHEYTPRNFDRMRRDAVAMERLTESPFIIDIYSYCGTTSMTEFGDGGDVEAALWPFDEVSHVRITQIEKLRIGKTVAKLSRERYDMLLTDTQSTIMPLFVCSNTSRYKPCYDPQHRFRRGSLNGTY